MLPRNDDGTTIDDPVDELDDGLTPAPPPVLHGPEREAAIAALGT